MRGFGGEVLNGADWRGRDFSGKRVGVLASGADAARIVPMVARTADAVKVFQEHPDWVLPPMPRTLRSVVARTPGARSRVARGYLRMAVRDEWTRRLLMPPRHFGSQVSVVSGLYFAALQRPNCTLITWPVYAIVPGGVRTAEGIEHRLDCLIIGDHATLVEGATV